MQESQSRSMFITWEEAQKLRPVLMKLSKEGPYAEVRRSAKRLYEDLGNVRKEKEGYDPFPGYQLLTSRYDRGVLDTVREVLED